MSFVSVLGRVRFVSCVLFSFLLHVYILVYPLSVYPERWLYMYGGRYFVFVS